MAPPTKRRRQAIAAARAKGAAKARMHQQAQARQTQQAIREEEILDEEMSVGSSVEWTKTCDAVVASQVPPLETTLPPQQQQQLLPRRLGLSYSEMMMVDTEFQQKRCAESIVSIEGNRTVTSKQGETLSESTARKRRKKIGTPHWRKLKVGENR